MKDFMGGCFLTVISAVFGVPLGLIGARAAGLPVREQDFGLEPLLYLVIGGVAGPAAFLILLAVLSCRKKGKSTGSVGGAFAGALALAFLSGVVGFRISEHNQQANVRYHQEQAAQSTSKQDEFHALLRADPGLAVREKWYAANDERREAYRHSLWQKDVAYSSGDLASLYAVSGGGHPESMAEHILGHPAFDPEVLKTEYHLAIRETLETGDCRNLMVLIESPKFEQKWLEELDQSGLLKRKDIRCVGSIRESIAKRFPNR